MFSSQMQAFFYYFFQDNSHGGGIYTPFPDDVKILSQIFVQKFDLKTRAYRQIF